MTVARDAAVVCVAGALRAAAVSMAGVLIAIHLASRGLTPAGIGLVLSAGVLATAAGTLLIGFKADRWGRRRSLLVLAVVAAAGYLGIAVASSLEALLVVAVLGLVNGMGRDRGPASTLDQAVIPSVVHADRRTWAMAWYNAAIDVGHAAGAIGGIVPTALSRLTGMSSLAAHATAFAIAGGLMALSGIAYLLLSTRIELSQLPAQTGSESIDARTRGTVHRLAGLFAIDSIGGGFLSSAIVAYWFFERYGMTEVQLAWLFFGARVLNVVSHLVAAWMARRIGLLNTMVWTHLPSSVFLMLAPAAPSAGLAAALFLVREALVEMDVPTRQSYVMAVVPASARTYASGMTNVTRNLGWGVGPVLGGIVMQHLALAGPLFIGGAMKIVYDLVLYRSFRSVRPPEER